MEPVIAGSIIGAVGDVVGGLIDGIFGTINAGIRAEAQKTVARYKAQTISYQAQQGTRQSQYKALTIPLYFQGAALVIISFGVMSAMRK